MRTVKDPPMNSVLRVERIVNTKVCEYKTQEEVERAIQEECRDRFTLAHSTPIMNTMLGERLRYLADEDIAKTIITGT